jgi:hypothetical protein
MRQQEKQRGTTYAIWPTNGKVLSSGYPGKEIDFSHIIKVISRHAKEKRKLPLT